jgi:hypothetical protein
VSRALAQKIFALRNNTSDSDGDHALPFLALVYALVVQQQYEKLNRAE